MESLPIEIISIIFSYIQKITDKRQFTQTCIKYNITTENLMGNIKLSGDLEKFTYPNEYCVEKFTLELCHDSYFNLIPMSYLTPNNDCIILALVMCNQFELLKLAINNGCNLIKNNRYQPCYYATKCGNKKMLKWMKIHGGQCTNSLYPVATQFGHLNIIKYLHKHIGPIGGYLSICCYSAAHNQNYKILEWLKIEKYQLKFDAYLGAIEGGGHLDMLEWLKNNSCEMDPYLCAFVATSGNLEILKWLRNNGCPWNSGTIKNAIRCGHTHIYNWAKENLCPE